MKASTLIIASLWAVVLGTLFAVSSAAAPAPSPEKPRPALDAAIAATEHTLAEYGCEITGRDLSANRKRALVQAMARDGRPVEVELIQSPKLRRVLVEVTVGVQGPRTFDHGPTKALGERIAARILARMDAEAPPAR